jgi:hypothetical protein
MTPTVIVYQVKVFMKLCVNLRLGTKLGVGVK